MIADQSPGPKLAAGVAAARARSLSGVPIRAIFTQRAVISTAGVTIAYVLAARLGAALAPGVSYAVAFWPATGLALAAILLGGRRMLPAVALGALAANLLTGVPLTAVLAIALGATLEALLGATLLGAIGFRGSLARMRDVGALVVLGAAISTTVGATIGVVSLSLAGALPRGSSPRPGPAGGSATGAETCSSPVRCWFSPSGRFTPDGARRRRSAARSSPG